MDLKAIVDVIEFLKDANAGTRNVQAVIVVNNPNI